MNNENKYINNNKVALVLEGGAMRGLYTAAILDVFMKNVCIMIPSLWSAVQRAKRSLYGAV